MGRRIHLGYAKTTGKQKQQENQRWTGFCRERRAHLQGIIP